MQPDPRTPAESRTTRALHLVATILVAAAMLIAALGSGNPDAAPNTGLPGWVDTLANVLAAGIGVLVLVPRSRAWAAVAAAAMMAASMVVNYTVDGMAFFLRALPFNLVTLVLAALLAGRGLRRDA